MQKVGEARRRWGLRVSEEKFRQKRFDKLPELLALIAAEEKRLPAKLLEQALN